MVNTHASANFRINSVGVDNLRSFFTKKEWRTHFLKIFSKGKGFKTIISEDRLPQPVAETYFKESAEPASSGFLKTG